VPQSDRYSCNCAQLNRGTPSPFLLRFWARQAEFDIFIKAIVRQDFGHFPLNRVK
jgi:hypothetical protein